MSSNEPTSGGATHHALLESMTPAKSLNSSSGKNSATKAATRLYHRSNKAFGKSKGGSVGAWSTVTAKHITSFIKAKTSHFIKPETIKRMVREGKIGVTPNKRAREQPSISASKEEELRLWMR